MTKPGSEPAAEPARPPGFTIPNPPRIEDLTRCVQCGLCLNVCPTFLERKAETASPRGRLYLMRALGEGRLGPTPRLAEHLDLCLGCQACEAACPSGVPFSALLEATRAELWQRRAVSRQTRLIRWLAFDQLLPHPTRLRLAAGLLRRYQRSPARRLLRRGLPTSLARAERLLPRFSERFFEPSEAPTPTHEARATLFVGCIMGLAFAETHRATLRLLRRAGLPAAVPHEQRCCGALAVHAGARERAKSLARRNIAAFEPSGETPIVVNAAGCGAFLKEYHRLLAGDPQFGQRARRFSARVRDLSETLGEQPLPSPHRPLSARIAYQDACHLAHAQGICQQPRELLASVLATAPLELADGALCCGSAGLYNLTHPEMANRLLERKVQAVRASGAEVVVSANPGCLIQLAAGLAQTGSGIRLVHLAELMDEAYARDEVDPS